MLFLKFNVHYKNVRFCPPHATFAQTSVDEYSLSKIKEVNDE